MFIEHTCPPEQLIHPADAQYALQLFKVNILLISNVLQGLHEFQKKTMSASESSSPTGTFLSTYFACRFAFFFINAVLCISSLTTYFFSSHSISLVCSCTVANKLSSFPTDRKNKQPKRLFKAIINKNSLLRPRTTASVLTEAT